MATKTKTAPKTSSAAAVQIPAAVRPAVKPSVADLLAKLGAPKSKASTKPIKDRPTLVLTPEAEAIFIEFAPAKLLEEHFKSNCDTLKRQLKDAIFGLWAQLLWKSKCRPESPSLKQLKEGKPDCEAMYVIQEKFKVQYETAADKTAAEDIAQRLVDLGLQEADATKLVENELDFTPVVQINLSDLLKGDAVHRSIGEKILNLMLGEAAEPLTEEERAVAMPQIESVEVRDGFLDRVCTYARSEEQLSTILKVIQPVEMIRGVKFAISDGLEAKTQRLIEKAAEILSGLDSE